MFVYLLKNSSNKQKYIKKIGLEGQKQPHS